MSNSTIKKIKLLFELLLDHPVYPWVILGILGVITLITGLDHEALWFDESFSAASTNFSIPAMINISSADCHPPLYYIILKIVTSLFGTSVFAIRLTSVFGIMALASLGIYPIKRITGQRIALLYTFFVFITPMTIAQGQEARMYGWAAYFVTGTFAALILAYREGLRKHWILFGAYSLCAAYTHYYAAISVTSIHLILLIALIVKKRELLKSYIVTALSVFVLYMPWMIPVFNQTTRVSKHFWIPPLNTQLFKNIIAYPLASNSTIIFPATFLPMVILYIFILVSIVAGFKIKNRNYKIIANCLLVCALTLGISVLLSLLLRPMLVERYMSSCLGLFILALVISISIIPQNIMKLSAIFIYTCVAVFFLWPVYTLNFKGPMNLIVDGISSQVTPDDIFIHANEHTMGTFSYYFPDNYHYLHYPDNFIPYANHNIFSHTGDYGTNYLDLLDNGRNIWVCQSIGAPLPLGEFYKSKYMVQKGNQRKWVLPPGWFFVTTIFFEYDKNRKTSDIDFSSADITITLNNIDFSKGDSFYYYVIDQGPLNSVPPIKSDKVEFIDNGKFIIKDVPKGYVVIGVFQDENMDGEYNFDAKTGMPKEGSTITNIMNISQDTLPTFDQVKILVDQENMELDLNFLYF